MHIRTLANKTLLKIPLNALILAYAIYLFTLSCTEVCTIKQENYSGKLQETEIAFPSPIGNDLGQYFLPVKGQASLAIAN